MTLCWVTGFAVRWLVHFAARQRAETLQFSVSLRGYGMTHPSIGTHCMDTTAPDAGCLVAYIYRRLKNEPVHYGARACGWQHFGYGLRVRFAPPYCGRYVAPARLRYG